MLKPLVTDSEVIATEHRVAGVRLFEMVEKCLLRRKPLRIERQSRNDLAPGLKKAVDIDSLGGRTVVVELYDLAIWQDVNWEVEGVFPCLPLEHKHPR